MFFFFFPKISPLNILSFAIYQLRFVCLCVCLLYICWLFTSRLAFCLLSPSQLEIDNGDELTADFLYEEVHPKQHAHKQAFAKPKGPAGKRGGHRITRAPGEKDDD